MSLHANPAIAAIGDAFERLEPCLGDFARRHGFVLHRSHDGSINVPRRWLRREFEGICQEIGLVVALEMPLRLERGFYPDLPCSIYVAASDARNGSDAVATICESQPYRLLVETLGKHLRDALDRLDPRSGALVSRATD